MIDSPGRIDVRQTLPWSDVNARPGFEVATLLEPYGLVPAPRERRKWACPSPECTSSDGFHTFAQPGRRSRCYVCQTRLTNVDLAAIVRQEAPRDACRWLAGQLGIYVEPWLPGPSPLVSRVAMRRARPPPIARPPTAREALLAMPDPVMPERLYADVLDRTSLTPRGAAYLRGRGIAPDFARHLGFRSVDGPSGWAALRKHLAATYTPETLRAAGFPTGERGRVWTPFGGLLPMLVIPFRHAGVTVFLRMRTIGPAPGRLAEVIPDWSDKANRYRAPKHVVPAWPFNADALAEPVVHVVEGELNATTLLLPPYRLNAVGFPGAGVLEIGWAVSLGSASMVVTWYDDDPAGLLGRARVEEMLAAAHGHDWVRRRIFHMRLPAGTDPNQLHVARALAPLVQAAPWMRLGTE